jgi:hypothetical protein
MAVIVLSGIGLVWHERRNTLSLGSGPGRG